MKKFLCLILTITLVICFVSCGKEKQENKNTIDLEYYAKLGKMPEAKYCLGENPQTVIDGLDGILEQEEAEHKEDPNHEHGHDEQEFYFEVVTGEKNVLLDNGNICYYYNKENESNGISCIVSYDSAFGFPIGTLILDVQDAISEFEPYEEPLTAENAFFADYVIDGTVLKAELNDATFVFVFQENALFATAIYNENWNV